MSDTGDIWQRYDAKVKEILALEARLAATQEALAKAQAGREHWARACRDLGKKLLVARNLAERLRSAERLKEARQDTLREGFSPPTPVGEFDDDDALLEEAERAREVLGLVLTALTKALDDREVSELGQKLRHHAGGQLLQSITRGSLTLVPVDGRFLVDRQWLMDLDVDALRQELDAAAQSGIYDRPEDSMISALNPALDVDVDVDDDDDGLVPPPPPSAAGFATLPPLLSALPDDGEGSLPPVPGLAARVSVPPVVSPPPVVPPLPTAAPPRSEDTVRSQTSPLSPATFIPNLRLSRLVKNPGTS